VLTVCIRCGIDDAREQLQRQADEEFAMWEAVAEELAAVKVQMLELANAMGTVARQLADCGVK
jgi:hypothetical protein